MILVYIHKHTHIYLYIRKIEKNPPKFDEFNSKVDIECLSYKDLFQDFEFMKNVIKIVMDV